MNPADEPATAARERGDAIVALLDLIAERHPRRVGKGVQIFPPAVSFHEYCGACHDITSAAATWPCEEVRAALAVALAINGASP